MLSSDPPKCHRSGFVGLVGRPNVGKSTLLNAFLRQSIAPVSPRPQTTRTRQLGILTMPDKQVIFVDTPGLHTPHHKLGEWMNARVEEVLRDSDVLLVIFDLSQPPQEDDKRVAMALEHLEEPPHILIALNKVDLLSAKEVPLRVNEFQSLLPNVERIPISATRGDQRQELLDKMMNLLPLGPRYFPEEDITDATERVIAADLIRAAALHLLRDEVPHSIAVHIDQFTERGDHGAHIVATLFVERESQKGIVIGKSGSMLKEIGTQARKEIEQMSGRKIFLELRVKLLKGWRNDIAALRRLGYDS
ncbi:MAG: GTPase Era [Chloroflexi bacterium RBG_16_48_8]|nr:MAG: GTPase Era [Chloroflexi bacterium RBG_16_48_8]